MNVSPLGLASLLASGLILSGCASVQKWREAKKRPEPPTFAPATIFAPATVSGEAFAIDPALLQRPTTEFRLGPGDLLEIEVLGDVATRSRATVGPDGKIYFYVLPGLDVWGLTLAQARERIVTELQKFVREQQPVSITLRGIQSQRIWVLGRLDRPGVYPMAGPMTLLEAISEAGGPSAAAAGGAALSAVGANGAAAATGVAPSIAMIGSNARGASADAGDLSRAFIIRQGRLLRVDFQKLLRQGDMSQNIYLQPDDMIYLPSGSIGSVHVLGAVGMPRVMGYTGRLTLAQSIAQGGGAVRGAHLTNVAIVRGSLTQPKVAVVDFQAIQAGTAPDVVLEPQDIVYVPSSPHRVLTRYVDMILDTFARTVGVNEGARAVGGQVAPVGVNVPIGGL